MKKLDRNVSPCEICMAVISAATKQDKERIIQDGIQDGIIISAADVRYLQNTMHKMKCSSGPYSEGSCLSKDKTMIKLLFLNLLGNKEFLEL